MRFLSKLDAKLLILFYIINIKGDSRKGLYCKPGDVNLNLLMLIYVGNKTGKSKEISYAVVLLIIYYCKGVS